MADTHDSIDRQYQSLRPALDRLETECRYIIEDALRQAGIKTHSVLSRVKTFDSVRDKVARKEKAGLLEEIDDLLGLRVVCLLRSDIARIGQLIRGEFEVISEDNKIDGANIEAFGYQSVHFIAKLNKSSKGRRYDGLHEQVFEIQLRTVAMDAWATLSHYLDYKNEADTPKDLRKDFFALSGLFYLADTHFEIFYAARRKSERDASERSEQTSTKKQEELNLDTLSAYLRKKFPDRDAGLPNHISNLLLELLEFGYTKFDMIDSLISISESKFRAYEKFVLADESSTKDIYFSDVGAVRSALAISDKKYSEAKKINSPALEKARALAD